MDNQKGSIIKTFFVILVFIVLFITVGYLLYDKIITQKSNEKEIKKLESQINELKKENKKVEEKNTNNSTNTNGGCDRYISANFYGDEKTTDANGNVFDIHETLKLTSDGKFENYYVNSGGLAGTYYIENGKINLSSPAAAMHDAYSATYDINSDCSVIKKDNVTLRRK